MGELKARLIKRYLLQIIIKLAVSLPLLMLSTCLISSAPLRAIYAIMVMGIITGDIIELHTIESWQV